MPFQIAFECHFFHSYAARLSPSAGLSFSIVCVLFELPYVTRRTNRCSACYQLTRGLLSTTSSTREIGSGLVRSLFNKT